MRIRHPRHAVPAMVVTGLLALTGCTVDPARLTLPGTGVPGPTYPVSIEFVSVLNLPQGAKVVANGARIGQLDRITVVDPTADRPGYAVADVEIQQAISLPAATRAQLRQDTVLGDIYISLDTTAQGAAGAIDHAGTIPVGQTEPALQIEDVISGLATFVSGGALRSAQDIVDQLNAALPQDPAETARIARVMSDNLIDVAARLEVSDAFLDAISANTAAVQNNRDALAALLTPEGARDITQIAQSLIHVVGIFGALGGLAHALIWVTPLVRAGDSAAKAFVPLVLANGRPLDLTAPSNLNRLSALLREKVIPFFERGPKVAVSGVEVAGAPTSWEQTDSMIAILRMIGMVR